MSNICKVKIEFGDDYGDNTCTFHCNLSHNHKGKHRETGILYGRRYKIFWEDKEKEIETPNEERFQDDD